MIHHERLVAKVTAKSKQHKKRKGRRMDSVSHVTPCHKKVMTKGGPSHQNPEREYGSTLYIFGRLDTVNQNMPRG
jgi:hypothetical protein